MYKRISPTRTDECWDYSGNYPAWNPLLVRHRVTGIIIAQGIASNWLYESWPFEFGPYIMTPDVTDEVTVATKGAAAGNPSRPHVAVPVMVAEFRDLPQLIRLAGRSLLGKLGSAYLMYKFGWVPLLNDLKALSEFADAVEKRKRSIRNLANKGGMRTKYRDSLYGSSLSDSRRITVFGSPWIEAEVTTVTTVRRWSTTRWTSTVPPEILADDSALSAYARKSVHGLTPGAISSHAWEALPWSWMADWFTNIGSYLTASDNSLAYATDGSSTVCTTSTSTATAKILHSAEGLSLAPVNQALYETKTRNLVHISPFRASLPFLTNGQLGILSALSATRLDAYRSFRR